ncbi:hypothetical protein K502DRAFT_332612 [Neoconidiobolus thromboides FSU 785]|nr:hypothetical protein K502DRAFT_332612 [Neoconidiobolus thromboides FSU 785]
MPVKKDSVPKEEGNPNKTFQLFSFKKLSQHLLKLQKKELYIEIYVLSRIYYKNFNQHRATTHFKMFRKFFTLLKRIDEMKLKQFSKELLSRFYNSKSQKKVKESWTHLPDPEFLKYSLIKLTGAYHLIQATFEAIPPVYNGFNLLVQKIDFVALSLAVLASISRIHCLLKTLRKDLVISLNLVTSLAEYYKTPIKLPKKYNLITFSKLEIEE